MSSSEHRNLLRQLASVDVVPEDSADYSQWLNAARHLTLLKKYAEHGEVIIYASSQYTFAHGVMVNEDAFRALTRDDLLTWNGNPFVVRAGYAWGGESGDVRLVNSSAMWPSISREHFQQLIFARTFHGLTGDDATSYEIRQEYLHASDLFWRPEQRAYCCFNEHGDFDPIISITCKTDSKGVTLVTFQRKQLEQFLAASNAVLLQMFEFILHRRGEFDGWSDGPEETISNGDMVYRQKIDSGSASYTRGVQIVNPSRTKAEIFKSIRNGSLAVNENPGVAFIAVDWRNNRLANISTHPSATTNYFEAEGNRLPFEVSPAFFRPDVLLKYKLDRDKYTLSEENRTIGCRSVWELQKYDINEEGQVHTYICYLRMLPYDEQIYWRSFNVEPKSGISDRSFQTDFEGEWSEIISPLEKVLYIARRWAASDIAWWTLLDEVLLERVNTPRTTSRDEWGRAFSDLAKLVIEGFQAGAIQARLEEDSVEYQNEEKSLKLIERFLAAHHPLEDGVSLVSLKTVQHIRTKVDAHYGGSDAQGFAADALMDHGSYTAHFDSICKGVAQELEMIEKAFS